MQHLLDKIQFVIVLYNNSLQNSESFRDITNSVKDITRSNQYISLFIYDNSPKPQVVESSDLWDIEYFHDANNSGLSLAYNVAAEYALNNRKEWLFILDQDTEFPKNTIEEYLRAIIDNPKIDMFAPILKVEDGTITSPYRYRLIGRKIAKQINLGAQSLFKTSPINSGLCISIKTFFEAGGYNEKVKVDGADFQFIERFRVLHKNYFVVNVTGYQNLSLFETDINKLMVRYKIFLRDTSASQKFRIVDYPISFINVAYRTFRLFLKTKKISIISTFFRNYIFVKN